MTAGVALAAGRGQRMRPLTDVLPKVLMPVAGTTLLDLALDRLQAHVGDGADALAVNAHHLGDLVAGHVAGRSHVAVEQPEALGTAGALGGLRGWLDGRDALVTNADVYAPDGLPDLVQGWAGVPAWDVARCRLLVVPAGHRRADFTLADGTGVRYVGACLLPWADVRGLEAVPSGLYEVLWRDLAADDGLDLVLAPPGEPWVDCGTPADYLAACLHASGGRSVVGAGAVVEGSLDECVVWPGAYVGADERLRRVVRAGSRAEPVTVATTV
ncbi:nucleotidyltransferase family protein [Angustibacter peucedani]